MKKAFTLAEILITLAIIGVVAAITIPSVLIDAQKTQFEAKLKKTYNILQNAVYISVAQNGAPATWGIKKEPTSQDTEKDLEQYIFPYLKVEKKSSDCSEIFGYETYKNVDGKPADPSKKPYSDACNYAVELTDGTVLAFNLATLGTGDYTFVFGFDLNGKKGPNRLGYDLHTEPIELKYENGKIITANVGSSVSYLKNFCKNQGSGCLSYIIKNNWKNDF